MNLSIFSSFLSWLQPVAQFCQLLETGHRQRAKARQAESLISRLNRREHALFIRYDADALSFDVAIPRDALLCTFKLSCTPGVIPTQGTKIRIKGASWNPEEGYFCAKGLAVIR